MAGIVNAMREMFNGGANAVRQAALTPEQIRDRDNGKRLLEMIKVAATVTALATIFLFAIFPNLFTAAIVGVTAFGATEVYKAADNVLEILNKALVELEARSSKEKLLDQVCKNTFVLGPFLRSLNLNVDGLLLG
jgi:hypothetical protein